ncbi:MAG TPA: sulfotransferase [Rhizomicrobium sp.]
MTAMAPSPDLQALFRQSESALRASDFAGSAQLLQQCLAQAPDFTAARRNYASLLLKQLGDPAGAIAQIDILLQDEPGNARFHAFRAGALGLTGDYDGALGAYDVALTLSPADAGLWLRYGHALKTSGRAGDAQIAYAKSNALQPSGEAWWSLADLKTHRFTTNDLSDMRSLMQRSNLQHADRAMLHFAIAKALEDAGDYRTAFQHYNSGNTLKRVLQGYNPSELTAYVDRAAALFTPAFFAEHAGGGDPAPDPIFVVGLPRSGSTLVEQILASHSAIEGTMELSDMIAVARAAMGPGPFDFNSYPGALTNLDPEALRALGADYLARTRVYRRAGKPLFIDKMPNNFVHTGLIHLILPNAKIIDVRRHPLACCLSAFKQHFAVGQNFSYDLSHLGHYYADYVRLMAHVDDALPGRVHRVFYEDLVADPENEVHRLLAYCGVPFEAQALRFHENRRAVRTASAEQVRRPIFTDGLESWRNFEPWLNPLKATLGPVLEAYPDVPVTPVTKIR